MRQKRKKKSSRSVWIRYTRVFLMTALLLTLAAGGALYGHHIGYRLVYEGCDQTVKEYILFSIEDGEDAYDIGIRLKQEKILENAMLFWIQSILYDTDFVPGEYAIHAGMSSRYLLEVFCGEQPDAAALSGE